MARKSSKGLSPAVPIAGALTFTAALAGIAGGVAMLAGNMKGKHEIDLAEPCKPFYETVTATYDSELWGFTSFDGLKLKAHHFSPKENSHRYAIIVHGYHGNYGNMCTHAQHFLEKGYHAVLPHLRGHGFSEGDYAGFGYHDHYDILGYIDLIREKDPESEIILLGESMGAATVMMVAGEYLPDNVKCIIEDAGYTDAFEQIAYNMKTLYHLPAFPLLHIHDLLVKSKYHYSLHDCSPIKAVAHASKPILFIHGDKDDFVPFSMQQPLFQACSSEKDLLIVPGAEHVQSVYTDPKAYWEKIDEFIGKYM